MLREVAFEAHPAADAAIGAFGDLRSYAAHLESIAAFRQPLDWPLAGLAFPADPSGWRP